MFIDFVYLFKEPAIIFINLFYCVCGEVGAVLEEVTAKETVKESSRQRKDRERGKRRGEGSEREMGEG